MHKKVSDNTLDNYVCHGTLTKYSKSSHGYQKLYATHNFHFIKYVVFMLN